MADDAQANHMTYLLAQIIDIAFWGHANDISSEDILLRWRSLASEVKIWKDRLPASFEPYFTAHITGSAFPVSVDATAMAW